MLRENLALILFLSTSSRSVSCIQLWTHWNWGLREYRNGGLLVDTGVLRLKDQGWLNQEVNVGTELVVEWRALTVILLDQVAERVRAKLRVSADALPLASILEGGTWQAGREIAKAKRADGSSPIKIRLDGTVF